MRFISRARRLTSRTALLIVIGLVLGTGGGVAIAAYTATTSSSSNSVQAAASFSTLRVASGTYAGNGVDDRAFTGLGFQPDLVIVKGDTNQVTMARTSTMTGDAAKPLSGGTALSNDRIQSLDADGFTTGKNNAVNANGINYAWTAFKTSTGVLKVGTYTGNGTSQSITGAGFSPEYVATMSAGSDRAIQRFTGMTSTFQFDADTGNANRITSLNADGFSVGSDNTANRNGTVFHYVAFNDVTGIVDANSYAGNGTDDRSVTGIGFQPDYVIIRANDTATARQAQHRPASLTGTNSLFFSASANSTNAIQALQSDGFQVGTDTSVNASSPTYHYIAFKNTP